MPIIQYQQCGFLCLTPACRTARRQLTYGLSCTGPWLVERDIVACEQCGQQYKVALDTSASDGGVSVRVTRHPGPGDDEV